MGSIARLSHQAASSPDMIVAVMRSAQGHREFVADLASHRARLGEPQVVSVSGLLPVLPAPDERRGYSLRSGRNENRYTVPVLFSGHDSF